MKDKRIMKKEVIQLCAFCDKYNEGSIRMKEWPRHYWACLACWQTYDLLKYAEIRAGTVMQ